MRDVNLSFRLRAVGSEPKRFKKIGVFSSDDRELALDLAAGILCRGNAARMVNRAGTFEVTELERA